MGLPKIREDGFPAAAGTGLDTEKEDPDAQTVAVDNTSWPDGAVRCR